jgi:phospholipid/cholesterol/gamma-HCH transport system substrate-binding protein
MKKYKSEAFAGVFVFLGLILIGYMTVKLGNVSLLGDDNYPVNARFKSVSGLRVGNPVEMLGLPIGSVSAFRMDQEDLLVEVEFQIDKGIRIYDDAIASIKTAGLIGDRYVSIDPGGGGELLKPGGVIIETESPVDLQELIGKYAFGNVEK